MIRFKLFVLFIFCLIVGAALYFRFYSEKSVGQAGKNGLDEPGIFEDEGDDHNISANFNTAMQRSVEFFDKYLK